MSEIIELTPVPYNVNDWALNVGIWERNQAWKPDSGWFYFDDGAGNHDLTRFWHGSANQDPGDQSNPHDRYEIMSYGSEARSRALGRVPENVQGFASIENMQGMWGSDPLTQHDFSDRKWHSGQFNFTNMQVKGFWDQLLRSYKLKSPQ